MNKFRELLDEASCERPNGAVSAVPKLLRSIIDHNPNVFQSPVKPKVVGMWLTDMALCAADLNYIHMCYLWQKLAVV